MNFNQQQQINPTLKVIKIIHLALLAGQVLFGAVTLFLRKDTRFNTSSDTQFLVIALVLGLTGVFIGNMIYKQVALVAAKNETFSQKLSAYQSALIIRYALLEGASLFSIVCFFLNGNLIFLLIAGLLVIYFIMLRPTVDTAAEVLNLSYEEKAELER